MIEVCAGTIGSVLAAHRGGADRVELCSALSEGGLTPSAGMIRMAKECEGLKVHVLIRPRSGDFVYSIPEVRTMELDILNARQLGADGVVIGALTADGDIDLPVCRRLADAARGMSITFHRAFDVCRRPYEALEQIISLGCDRLLTSGQASTAEEGIPVLGRLVRQSAGRIIIMPGSGVNPRNALHILRETGATEIHGSFRSSTQTTHPETDEASVSALRKLLSSVCP